jgi:hypothetical protein
MDYSMLLGVHELTEHDLFARPDRPGGAVTPRRAVEHVASIPSVCVLHSLDSVALRAQ